MPPPANKRGSSAFAHVQKRPARGKAAIWKGVFDTNPVHKWTLPNGGVIVVDDLEATEDHVHFWARLERNGRVVAEDDHYITNPPLNVAPADDRWQVECVQGGGSIAEVARIHFMRYRSDNLE